MQIKCDVSLDYMELLKSSNRSFVIISERSNSTYGSWQARTYPFKVLQVNFRKGFKYLASHSTRTHITVIASPFAVQSSQMQSTQQFQILRSFLCVVCGRKHSRPDVVQKHKNSALILGLVS